MQQRRGGQKRAFSVQQIQALENLLLNSPSPRRRFLERALLRLAVDSMLRASDLLKLTVGDVLFEGKVREQVELRQQKTGVPHVVSLSEKTCAALSVYILMCKPRSLELRLFPFRIRAYQDVVKRWAKMLQLDPRFYSSHSLRRTKAKLIYDRTQNIEVVRQLLGQSSIESTRYYLGVELEDAHRVAREIEI